jgi:hypothetical protein
MFDPEMPPEQLRPWLNDVGRATVVQSLRTSLESGEFVPSRGDPLSGAWN